MADGKVGGTTKASEECSMLSLMMVSFGSESGQQVIVGRTRADGVTAS